MKKNSIIVSNASAKKVIVPFRNPAKVKPYLAALTQVGLDPHAHLTDAPAHLDGMYGLLLMGGTDVNPQRYHQAAQSETDPPDDERDAIELDILNQAIEKDVPILAICRGLQLLNIYHGGSLVQHLGSVRHDPELEDTAQPAHNVIVEPGTLLYESVNQPCLRVNSRHHQSVSQVGSALRISARSTDDGVIEGLERPDRRFVLAVQWHPEDQVRTQAEQLRLFAAFAKALG